MNIFKYIIIKLLTLPKNYICNYFKKKSRGIVKKNLNII